MDPTFGFSSGLPTQIPLFTQAHRFFNFYNFERDSVLYNDNTRDNPQENNASNAGICLATNNNANAVHTSSHNSTAPHHGGTGLGAQNAVIHQNSAGSVTNSSGIVKTTTTKRGDFPCEICGRSFTQKGNLKSHMYCHSGEKPYNCEVCGKGFTQRSSLDYHNTLHLGEKPFGCDVCGKRFTQKGNLKTHMNSHTGTRPYCCEICGRGFTQKGNMKTHLATHYGEKPFSCEVCDKRFTLKGNLKTHVLAHEGIKPFTCEVCQKAFSQKLSLEYHMNSHMGKKPYTCDICGKGFTQKGNMKTHMRSHTGEKLYTCQICGKGFTQKGNMKTHMKIHMRPPSPTKPYFCGMCGKSFVLKSSLECHMSTHIPKQLQNQQMPQLQNQLPSPSRLPGMPQLAHSGISTASSSTIRSISNIQASIQSSGSGMCPGRDDIAGSSLKNLSTVQGNNPAGNNIPNSMCMNTIDKPTVVMPGGAVLSAL